MSEKAKRYLIPKIESTLKGYSFLSSSKPRTLAIPPTNLAYHVLNSAEKTFNQSKFYKASRNDISHLLNVLDVSVNKVIDESKFHYYLVLYTKVCKYFAIFQLSRQMNEMESIYLMCSGSKPNGNIHYSNIGYMIDLLVEMDLRLPNEKVQWWKNFKNIKLNFFADFLNFPKNPFKLPPKNQLSTILEKHTYLKDLSNFIPLYCSEKIIGIGIVPIELIEDAKKTLEEKLFSGNIIIFNSQLKFKFSLFVWFLFGAAFLKNSGRPLSPQALQISFNHLFKHFRPRMFETRYYKYLVLLVHKLDLEVDVQTLVAISKKLEDDPTELVTDDVKDALEQLNRNPSNV